MGDADLVYDDNGIAWSYPRGYNYPMVRLKGGDAMTGALKGNTKY